MNDLCMTNRKKTCEKDKSENEKKSDLNPNEIMKEEEKEDNQECARSTLSKILAPLFISVLLIQSLLKQVCQTHMTVEVYNH